MVPEPLIALEIEIPPALAVPNVKPPVFVIAPVLIVNVFVPTVTSVFIVEAVCAVIPPVNVVAGAPAISLIAPVLLGPLPFNVNTSGIVKADAPLISIAAPVPTKVL